MTAMRVALVRAGVCCASAVLWSVSPVFAQMAPSDIPIVPGLALVLAVHAQGGVQKDVARGDYETVVTLDGTKDGISVSIRIDATDGRGNPMDFTVKRRVSTTDLARARVQVLGFSEADPLDIAGATLLGPSRTIMRDLRTAGRAEYAVYNYFALAKQRAERPAEGTLVRVDATPVPFPVLVNGKRIELPAVRVTGQLKTATGVFPWEQYLFDHPQHPLTLRWAYGRFGSGIPFDVVASRDVVRIDFPVASDRSIETALATECRVEMPGIYFDFDRATLKPASSRALTTIADLLRRQPEWRLAIEGHTDNSGSDKYNQDLSMRRAGTVRTTLIRDFGIGPARLTSAGFGARRPVETNDTMAGRARNRRVELVRECERAPKP